MPIQGQSLRTFRKDLRELVLYGPTSLGKSWFACVQFTLTLHPIDCQSSFSQPIHCQSQTTQSVQTKPFTNQPILVHSANPMPIQCPSNTHPAPIHCRSSFTRLNQSEPISTNPCQPHQYWSDPLLIFNHSANPPPLGQSIASLQLHSHYNSQSMST